MHFLAFLSMVFLSAHILSPLGSLFTTWLNLQNPHLLTGFPAQSRYYVEIVLLHLPATLIVIVFWFYLRLFDRLPERHPNASKYMMGGISAYLIFAFGRNLPGNLGDHLNTYVNEGLLFSRILLLIGCFKVLLVPAGGASGNSANAMGPGAGPGGGGDDAALAALMGMMGGGGPPPGPAKKPPRRNPGKF